MTDHVAALLEQEGSALDMLHAVRRRWDERSDQLSILVAIDAADEIAAGTELRRHPTPLGGVAPAATPNNNGPGRSTCAGSAAGASQEQL